jgi:probable O-glycosylation ligase (exosortase A-associated)
MIYYGLLLFFFFEYFRPGNYLPFLTAMHANALIPILVFIFAVFSNKNVSNSELLKNYNAKLMMFFLFLILLSIATADVTFYAYTVFKTVLGYFLIYVVISKQLDSVNKMKGVFVILILVHILLAILNPEVVLNPAVRSTLSKVTFLGDGNDFSLSLCIAIPFCMFLMQESNNKRMKIAFIALLILMIICIIGTQSRGGTIALAVIFAYQWFKSKKKITGMMLILAVIAMIIVFAPQEYTKRIIGIKTYQTDGSAQGRIRAWKAATRMANDHPLLGVGAGHFPVKYGRSYMEQRGKWLTAHSIYFLVLGELGYPGLLFLLLIIYVNMRSNERDLKEMKNHDPPLFLTHQRLLICLKASMLAYAVGGAFLSALYYPHIYVLSGLFTARYFILKVNLGEIVVNKKDNKIMHNLREDVPQQI